MPHSSRSPQQRNNVHVLGEGEATIVLAHGFGNDQTVWRHQAAALSRSHRVVLFDHVGATAANVDEYSPRRYRSLHGYADDLLEILAELDAERVCYVGHSMSGMIGLLAALVEPERFSRMLFLCASPRYLNDGDYRGGFEQSDIDGLYAAMGSSYHAWASGFAGVAVRNLERPELSAEFASTLSAIRPDIALAVARIIFQSDHRAELPKLRVPTLIVQSTNDIAVPTSVGEYLAAHIPGATLRTIAAEGHLPHLSVPEVVLEVLSSFFDLRSAQTNRRADRIERNEE